MSVMKIRRPVRTMGALTVASGGITATTGSITAADGTVSFTTGGGVDNFVKTHNATTGALNNFGINVIQSGTGTDTWTLGAPTIGVEMSIYCTAATSSNKATVTLTSDSSLHSSSGSTALETITFEDGNDGITLVGVSAAKWYVKSSIGAPVIT